jgi:hypothetical protein
VDPEAPLIVGGAARAVLLAPDVIARTIAATEADPLRRWLLRRPRAVRRSFAYEVIDAGGTRVQQERWLLLQEDAVRESYVAEVIDATSSFDDE